jgi:hypothetical protein
MCRDVEVLHKDVQRDWSWSDGFLPEVRRILALNAAVVFSFSIASFYRDAKQATDMVITASGELAIAVRLRRPNYRYRDLTLRATRSTGIATELEKIRQGYGDYYLYGWTGDSYSIQEWMFVDLSTLRTSGLLDVPWRVISNADRRTGFIAIPAKRLLEAGCIVNHQIPSLQTKPIEPTLESV